MVASVRSTERVLRNTITATEKSVTWLFEDRVSTGFAADAE